MFRYDRWAEEGWEPRSRPRLVPAPGPRLFQIEEPRRPLVLPITLAVVVHGALLYWSLVVVTSRSPESPKHVAVVFKKPPPPKLTEPAGGGSPPPRPKPQRKKLRVPTPPPELKDPPPQPEQEPEPEPPEFVEAGDPTEGVPGGTGLGTGTGIGTGTGSGTGTGAGPGTGGKSKERKAWLQTTNWRCSRPGMEDLGRIVVRIRVEVRTDGNPGEVTAVKSGGQELFDRRAIACAQAEKYIPALDPEGTPIPAFVEFGIEFLL